MTWTICLIWCGLCALWLVGLVVGIHVSETRRIKRLDAKWAAEAAREAAMPPEDRERRAQAACLLYFVIYVPDRGAM